MSFDPERSNFAPTLRSRRTWARIGRWLFIAATVVALAALMMMLYNVATSTVGLVAVEYEREPSTLVEQPLEEVSKEELVALLQANISAGLFRRLEHDQPFATRSRETVYDLVIEHVVAETIVRSWPLDKSLVDRAAIEAEIAADYPTARVRFHAWLQPQFLTRSMSSNPEQAGVRTALLGSLWMVLITMLLAFPIGVGSAIYLEEYASDTLLNSILQSNINNLAGIPSIIYGMLGLAIFVRTLEPYTSGAAFGVLDGNGRTILSASLTMALLILPIIIVSAQEAIRAVPQSIRLASYGLGATRWQTTWYQVLPVAMPGILTGTILAMSRAIGETAPLIVVGASTFIVSDPTGPFSKFTVLPIQIYQWTSRPQAEFRHLAATAIVVLLVLLLTLNATAVLVRQRLGRLP
ncbi:MAG: phosphate ABC transporter permease PstA [Ardenticatenales bacterium]|nr:phosphate ABC transporter permease PstA [Ardenticatenales bacterium]